MPIGIQIPTCVPTGLLVLWVDALVGIGILVGKSGGSSGSIGRPIGMPVDMGVPVGMSFGSYRSTGRRIGTPVGIGVLAGMSDESSRSDWETYWHASWYGVTCLYISWKFL